jgi:hypothetical protein
MTDGDPVVLERLGSNRNLNQRHNSFQDTEVVVKQLLWQQEKPLGGARFDVAIAADCVYNYDDHQTLCACIKRLLRPGGIAVVVAPPRMGSLQKFTELARQSFSVSSPSGLLLEQMNANFKRMKCRPQVLLLRGGIRGNNLSHIKARVEMGKAPPARKPVANDRPPLRETEGVDKSAREVSQAVTVRGPTPERGIARLA